MGKSASQPPPVDYGAAARAQGVANVETARVQGRISNPNIIGPLGNQTTTWNAPVFDQVGFDKAMADYTAGTAGNVTPTREQFTTIDDQATVTQTLTPQATETLKKQQLVELALAELAQTGVGTAKNVLGTKFDPALDKLTTSIGDAGKIDQSIDLSRYGQAGGNINAGQISRAPNFFDYGSAGANVNVQRVNAGPRASDFGYAQGNVVSPELQNQIDTTGVGNVNYGPQPGQYGFARGTLDTSDVARMPVNAGITGQQAIMNRLGPDLERADAALRQRLINQGLVSGGEAYENAMISQNQQKNDLLSQAALHGIGLDTAANLQGYNQALQSGQFGNQAIVQNFGQAQAAQAAQNAAQNQAFNQRVQSGQFGNEAQLASFGAGMQNAGLFNSALNQNLNVALSTQQAQNAAAQQLYNQYMGIQGLQNEAVAQNQQTALTQQQAANAAQQQGFGQQVTQRQIENAAIAQNQQAALQQQQARLTAQNQQYNQLLQSAQFGNTATQQSLQQQLALRNQPLNEISALMSGSQIQMPSFQGYQGASVAPPPIFQGAMAQGQAGMDLYGINSANANAANAGMYGLAGTAATAGAMAFMF